MQPNTSTTNIIKNFHPTSLFVSYLTTGLNHLPARYVNLNSKTPVNQLGQDTKEIDVEFQKKSTNFRTATSFTTKATDSTLAFTYNTPALDDVETQNVKLWKGTIQNIAKLCGWTDEQQKHVVQISINPIYTEQVLTATATDEAYQKIIQIANPKRNLNELLDKLQNTTQTDFYLINEYFDKTQELTQAIGDTQGSHCRLSKGK